MDIVAPSSEDGVGGIYTTVPTAMDTSGYKYSGGTSCATPQVTATVAMMLALNPYQTPAQIEQRLIRRAGKSLPGTINTSRTFPTLNTGKAVSMTNYNP